MLNYLKKNQKVKNLKFKDNLNNSIEGKSIGLSYFRERGFSADTIDGFDLGFSSKEINIFTKTSLEKGYDKSFLEKTGLSIFQENKSVDRFRGRVIFPFHSMSGRVLGFGARILYNHIKTAKYLNSPESLIYNKSKVLYGIYYSKQEIAKLDNCYIVEGYTDVIQLHEKGIKNVVDGKADALLDTSVETGNGLVKMMIYFMGACAAGVVVGGKVPVVITSRSDEAQARLASIAAAVVALD